MAIKALQKSVKKEPVKAEDKKVERFISKGGTLANPVEQISNKAEDHRLTLRIPKWLVDKVDTKRKERVGKISRNLWILEVIEKAAK